MHCSCVDTSATGPITLSGSEIDGQLTAAGYGNGADGSNCQSTIFTARAREVLKNRIPVEDLNALQNIPRRYSWKRL
jgi:hypothetical protein